MSSIDFIKFPLKLLSTLGISIPKTSNVENLYKFQWNWLLPIAVLNTLYSGIGQVNTAITYYQRGEDLWIVTSFMYTFTYHISAMAKLYLILSGTNCFKNLLIELDEIFPRTPQQQHDYRLKEYFQTFAKFAFWLAFLQISLAPYVTWSTMMVNYFESPAENRTFKLELPFGDEYPFYNHSTFSFVVVLINQILEAYICVAIVYAVNLIVCGFISQIQMHYDHLHLKLVSFNRPEPDQNDYEHVVWCIKKQNQLDVMFYQLNDACSMGTLIGIYCGCVQFALFSFMGIHISHWNDLMKNIIGAMSSCMEMFTLCWFSQKITDSVRAVNEGIYQSDWTNKSNKYKKAMVVMIQQNQRTLSLKAYKFADLSMELFADILKFSYRLVMVLNNFN